VPVRELQGQRLRRLARANKDFLTSGHVLDTPPPIRNLEEIT
jgi:hypothetical protein